MMKMAQAVNSSSLANPGINCEHHSERLKIQILQFQILTTALSISVPTIAVVAQ
jgi:hypothetical protein